MLFSEEIEEILNYIGIETQAVTNNFEMLLFTRLDTQIMLTSINNANINTLRQSVEENSEILNELLNLQNYLSSQPNPMFIIMNVMLGVLGLIVGILIFILVGTSWKA